ncbi:hypothetical protein [Actinopolymorpha pittospori]|uniref:Protein kinase domain-containing protein n=1 Tax=Actinopolymorpha pittospori TaxID=648752 RepID=A0A927MUU4_9ACTN|nr:hypothetical protein [Actinopolymorpha pittospori]MBE1603717.1 hypothetical protein [Actinopolymorpha pittospori]
MTAISAGSAGQRKIFPSGAEYSNALQNTAIAFRRPDLKAAQVTLTKLGMPKALSGNFASVFSLRTTTGQRYALKCFTRYVPDQEKRYDEISTQLAKLDPARLSQPWKMGFEYLSDSILVNGSWYPVLKMEWVEATTLARWLEGNYSDRGATAQLATRFAALTADLDANGIAHGDLQHGNLLVASDGTFRLVDYDGMYVPGMRGLRASENGHRHYQSPVRSSADFGPLMDRFSSWVIYLSLLALSVDPSLWNRLHEPGSEYLLLTEDDYNSPDTATRFPELLSHTDRTVRDLAELVRSLTRQPLNALPALSTSQTTASRSVGTPRTQRSLATGARAVSPGTSANGLPGWLTSHISATVGSPPLSPATISTVGARFSGRRFAEVLLMLLLPLSIVVPGLLELSGQLAPHLVPAVLGAATGGTLALSWPGRRTRPETKDALGRVRELKRQRIAAKNPLAAASALQRERDAFERAESSRSAAVARKRQDYTASLTSEMQSIERAKSQEIQKLDHKISGLDSELRTALRAALAPLQRRYVESELQKAQIARASLSKIGPKIVANLAAVGIRTAGDFTDFRLLSGGGRYNSTTAVLVLTGGRSVHVDLVGPERARTLKDWRDRLKSRAEAACPIQLTAKQRDDIETKFKHKRVQLENERTSSVLTAQKKRGEAQRRVQRELDILGSEDASALARAKVKRSSFDQRASDLQNARVDFVAIEAALRDARQEKHGLSHTRYLWFVLTGR